MYAHTHHGMSKTGPTCGIFIETTKPLQDTLQEYFAVGETSTTLLTSHLAQYVHH